jgi:hypothetical protein
MIGKTEVAGAYNPAKQFPTIDILEHHVDLRFASSDLNKELKQYS